jgi:hypothetical protein
MTSTTVSIHELFRDMYPAPGSRLKQWVVDSRREQKWEDQTCPRFDVPEHDDNTGASCRNVGRSTWKQLEHDCCGVCCDLQDEKADDAQVAAWLTELDKRPPIEADRSKLSDEIEPDWHLAPHPFLREP